MRRKDITSEITEVTTRINCYQDFLQDLEELDRLIHNSYVDARNSIYNSDTPVTVREVEDAFMYARDRIRAKIGDLSFQLETSVTGLEEELDYTLDEMESADRQHEQYVIDFANCPMAPCRDCTNTNCNLFYQKLED